MSVRGERIVYRERDVERERDSDRGSHYEAPRRTYTTVKRYQVPETSRLLFNGEDKVEEDKQIVIRRERRESPPPREEVTYRVTERVQREQPREREREQPREREREQPREEVDYRFTERIREREREPPSVQRRDISYRVIERDSDQDRSSAGRSEFRATERERASVRAPSPPEREPERVREFRFEREREFSPPRRREQRDDPYDVERYSKSTEYFSQPQPIIIREAAPQPIIIREERREPIIIREERREPVVIREEWREPERREPERRETQYEFIEREEVKDETRSLVRRESPLAPSVHPAASIHPTASIHPAPSVNRAQSTHSEKAEEENYFYERRVVERDRGPRRRDDSYDDRRSEVRPRDSASQYSSDESYEYVRRERIRDDSRDGGREGSPKHRRHLAEGAIAGIGAAEIFRSHKKNQGENVGGRAKSAVAGAAVGALGAEAVSRVRAYSRRRKSRTPSPDDSYDDRRDRRGKRKEHTRDRSKSLSRAQQLGALAAVTAVGALAGYALKKKGNNETVIIKDEAPRRSRSRRRRASADSSYTENTMLSEGGGRALDPEHRNRRMAQAGLATAAAAGIWDRVRSKSRGGTSQSRVKQAVPIVASGLGGAALAGLYEKNKATKEAKKAAIIEGEMGRGRRSSRMRSRSRSRSAPAPYPADDRYVDDRGLIAYGHEPIYPDQQRGYYSDEEPAHEIGKRRERSRQREEAQRHDEEPYQYGNEPYPLESPTPQPGGYLPPHQQGAYGNEAAYPSSTYFPPPPTDEYARGEPEPAPYPQYNPADFAQGGPQQPYHQSYGGYGESDATLGAPHPNDTFAGDPRYGATPDATQYDERNRGRNPENVSAPIPAVDELEHAGTFQVPAQPLTQHADPNIVADGVSTPRARSRSQSRVRFNLDANQAISPEASRKGVNDERQTDSESKGEDRHRRRRRRGEGERGRGGDGHRDPPGSTRDTRYERENDSDNTVELPERFDEQGNRKAEGDPLADGITKFLGGAGFADLLGRLGGGGGGEEEDTGRSGRRRHRR
ncbi:hypothetical protein LTR91_004956 [Friedmanniomyces endolithicus]|uniref:DUF3824 domain-containing protein n=1 Tax=Friedmanniomyces endolithicus TaxID=329885 RepID=A0AAN6QY26_9PEZI|nr:hypothetical protein LTR57_007970 [Friedmanniomyces endolithicus]KAK1002814.1 hypothetical protein LTR91_004956 [Friedmanniomyces endolithicus]KAK1039893.1 hypothetical protein LTS16_010833 [Friedmanniomyces endolithicus]